MSTTVTVLLTIALISFIICVTTAVIAGLADNTYAIVISLVFLFATCILIAIASVLHMHNKINTIQKEQATTINKIQEEQERQQQELTDYIEQTDDIATIYINGISYNKQTIDVDTVLNHYTLDHIDAETDAIYLTD